MPNARAQIPGMHRVVAGSLIAIAAGATVLGLSGGWLASPVGLATAGIPLVGAVVAMAAWLHLGMRLPVVLQLAWARVGRPGARAPGRGARTVRRGHRADSRGG